MNAVMIIPTGVGAEIGGHAGDGNVVARLLAAVCDKLIIHPNVVNASDINEMPENCLYVEGSMLDRFLRKEICLEEVSSNKILVVVNSPLNNETVNAVSAARATIGLDASILILDTPLVLTAYIKDNQADGGVEGWYQLVEQVKYQDFDALAITTPIDVDKDVVLHYLQYGGINPWGGVEAKVSKLISTALDKPVAHAPMDETMRDYNEIVDPRLAAEMVSMCYLHCVLKGLHKAPRIGKGLCASDISCLVTPVGCVGEPHIACLEAGIPIIAIKENKTWLNDKMPDEFVFVENYLEATGLLVAMKTGIHPASVRRPLEYTKVLGR